MKIAAAFHSGNQNTIDVVNRMAAAQDLQGQQKYHVFPVKKGALACLPGSDRSSAIPFLIEGSGGNVLILTGVPTTTGESLQRKLRRIVDGDVNLGARELSELDGAFAAFFWDAKAQRLAIVTDFIGLQPLYISRPDGYLLFATEIKGITGSELVRLRPDPGGWGTFLGFGHFIGAHTSVQEVCTAKAGTIYIYDPVAATLSDSQYWDYPKLQQIEDLAAIDTEAIVGALRASITAYFDHCNNGTALLSGGFDSRMLLMLLLEAEQRPGVVILEHPDEQFNVDARLAQRLAHHFGLRYSYEKPARSFFASGEYIDYVVMNEVATPSLYLYISQLAAFLKSEMVAVWEGIAPGATLTAPGGDHGNSFAEQLHLKCKLDGSPIWRAARYLFKKTFADEMYGALLDEFNKESSKYEDNGYGVAEFVLRNRMRNRTGPNPMKVYANSLLAFTPGVSRRFFELTVGIPYSLRARHRLYLEIYRRHFPKAAEIPFASGDKLYPGARAVDIDYQVAKLVSSKQYKWWSARIGRRLGRRQDLKWWDESVIVDRAIQAACEEGDEVWNPDALRNILTCEGPPDLQAQCRAIPFYWQMWKWIMQSRLSARPSPARQFLLSGARMP